MKTEVEPPMIHLLDYEKSLDDGWPESGEMKF